MGYGTAPHEDQMLKGITQTVVEERSVPQSMTEEVKDLDDLPEENGTYSISTSRRQTFGEVSDYFVREACR